MRIKSLYRYMREEGRIAESPIKPECEYRERVRIIADSGKLVTKDGEKFYLVIDADSAEGFYEVDKTEVEDEVQSA